MARFFRYITVAAVAALAAATVTSVSAERSDTMLKSGWQFSKADTPAREWVEVSVPHDWAITGPFDIKHDLQITAVEQNGETEKTLHTGRTGGLPFMGKGVYRRQFEVADTKGKSITLLFDGAMSNAHVKVNGQEVIFWPYGYNSFYVCLDGVAIPGKNDLEVALENFDEQSRWYAGAGLYRNVHLIETNKIRVPVWGTHITTPVITDDYASVELEIAVEGAQEGQKLEVCTEIKDASGKEVARKQTMYRTYAPTHTQSFIVENPQLWSPEDPYLYTATTRIIADGKEIDSYDTRFGIRDIKFVPEKGFFLNGKPTKIKGVCNHHDLGALGTAINNTAIRKRVLMLKDMGANAIRTSHNMPSPELVSICEEEGMMLLLEPFDDWGLFPKSPNGYGKVFNEWAERDVTNMVKHYRNSPAVIMWSIGNEVPSQGHPKGIDELRMLQDLVHSLDTTRPVTCGMEKIGAVMDNGFAAALDIPAFNYKPQYYREFHQKLPQGMLMGSETASDFSSRGMYFWPVEFRGQYTVYHEGNHCSSYDCENSGWSNVPDLDFYMDETCDYLLGQFVWTGFDYLGEPTPYDKNAWPSHSSMFGIIDMANLPKDRYYLYRSVWNTDDHTLHILPHWTHPGREGKVTPVFVYTDYPEAELFINGKSQGRQKKLTLDQLYNSSDTLALYKHYRLMWKDVVYQPGELKVVAYDHNGKKAEEKTIRTAGAPHHLVLEADRKQMDSDGEDIIYVTVRVADKDGNIVPADTRKVQFSVKGAGNFKAVANGDPTCIEPFHNPEMSLFSGALTAIVQSNGQQGDITFEAKAKGVKGDKITLTVL